MVTKRRKRQRPKRVIREGEVVFDERDRSRKTEIVMRAVDESSAGVLRVRERRIDRARESIDRSIARDSPRERKKDVDGG